MSSNSNWVSNTFQDNYILWNEKRLENVKAYNKETRQLVAEKLLLEYPNKGYEDQVRNIPTINEHIIDLRNGKGKGINISEIKLKYKQGIDSKMRRRLS